VTIACTREFLSTELGLVQLLNIINNLLPTNELHLANSAILVILVLYIWELLPSLSNCLLVYMLCGFENVFYKVLVVVNKSDAKEPFLLCLECAHISIGYWIGYIKTRLFRPICKGGDVFAESFDEPVPRLIILTFNNRPRNNPALIISIMSDG
jgi:hypothetical protein